jgi:acyl-CoA synthetase (AMP-forming)/AMP-acid ligase II
MSNFINKLNKWTKITPNKTIYTYINEKKEIEQTYTYLQFKNKTDRLAKYLLKNIKEDRLLLIYPTGLEFLVSFVACLKAKIIPIPAYPPNPFDLKKDIIKFYHIVNNSGAKIALTDKKYNFWSSLGTLKSLFTCKWPELKWIITDKLKILDYFSDIKLPEINEIDMAFIQYTSGTIKDPKPIKVRHKNLFHNLESCNKLDNGKTIIVSWLPQYHDFGLIASRLVPIYYGATSILISPYTFIKNPIYFLELCSNYKATHIQGPNFMYGYLCRKWSILKDKPEINLSYVDHILNAAETINIDTYENFYTVFKKYGLKRESLSCGYGIAESIAYVTDTKLGKKGNSWNILVDEDCFKKEELKIVYTNGKKIASCGKPNYNVIVGIYDNNKNEILNELNIGEIIVSSDSVVEEYKTLQIDDKKYLKTGDLGFLYQGELFVTGRIKDIIIINGKNYYPNDFEWIIEKNDNIRGGSTAVFENNNILTAVTEIKKISNKENYKNIVESIKDNIIDIFGMHIKIYLIEPKTIPKTTSGKIKRQKCKEIYLTLKHLHVS